MRRDGLADYVRRCMEPLVLYVESMFQYSIALRKVGLRISAPLFQHFSSARHSSVFNFLLSEALPCISAPHRHHWSPRHPCLAVQTDRYWHLSDEHLPWPLSLLSWNVHLMTVRSYPIKICVGPVQGIRAFHWILYLGYAPKLQCELSCLAATIACVNTPG